MSVGDDVSTHVLQKLVAAKAVSHALAAATTAAKNDALVQMSEALWDHRAEILAANAEDVHAAKASGQTDSRIDRLVQNPQRLKAMAMGLQQVAELPDGIGETLETIQRPNGLEITKVRVPIGVIAMIYESRPNVTVDAAGLCIKTGNAVVLRGGRESLRTNMAIVRALHMGLQVSALPTEAIGLIERVNREAVDTLITARGLVDLVIPRGGAGLIQRIVANAKVPVIETGVGNCHVYVDAAADFSMATAIVVNAKAQRPSVCNAAETLLVHEAIAKRWLPQMAAEFKRLGVALRLCPAAADILSNQDQDERNSDDFACTLACDADWETEFLGPTLAVKVVGSLDEAIAHIERYGTHHSEVIVTENGSAADTFLARVDAAVVYHNASTRFTDGFEFGFGAEIGISTQKLHARGPMGLQEMTSYKYVVHGTGQVRQ